MIDYKYADLFLKDSVDKQFIITTDDGAVTITNTELHQEQFELNESICSESTLRFGACESSSVKFRMSNVFTSLKGKWITVKCVLNGNADEPFMFGRYKVDSDKPTADKRYRDIVAYDVMYDLLTADVADWYNSLTFPMPLKTFRNALISHFNLEEVEITLPNDEMTVERTIEPSEISGKDVLTAICEINACFGNIGRDGKFQYVMLKPITEGLYPSNTLYPANDLFPRDINVARIGSSKYIKATYEDFVTQRIDKVQIRQEENDIGGASGEGDNGYVIEDNFLVYSKSTDELNNIAAKFLSAVGFIVYRPSSVNATGNPCLEVGDSIKVNTKYQNIETYILSRTLKGVQGLKDAYTAKGEEYYGNNVNSVQRSIIQLKGKANELTRTVEETRSTITDVEQGLQTQITQNAQGITAEAERAENAEKQLRSSISLQADQIRSEVSATYSTKSETSSAFNDAVSQASADATTKANAALNSANANTNNKLLSYSTTQEMNSAIDQRANSILISVEEDITETRTYIDGQVNTLNTELSASIKVNSDAITSEVSRAQNAETELSTEITQTASSIEVEISSIDGRITQISADLDSVSSQISGYDGRFNKIEQTIEGVTFQDEDGATKISGNVIETGIIKGISVLFIEQDSLYWACGATDWDNIDTTGEWVCDSNALYAHDTNGNRSIELDRGNGNGIFYGDVILRGGINISLYDTYFLASNASDSVGSIESDISALKSDVNLIESDISALKSDVSLLWGDLSNVESGLSSTDNKVSSLGQEIVNTNASLSAAVSRISTNESDIAIHDKSILGLETRLAAVEEVLGL